MVGIVNESRRKWILAWTTAVLTIVVAVAAWFLTRVGDVESSTNPSSTPSFYSPAAATASIDPFEAHETTIQRALNSGDAAGISAILPLSSNESPDPDFAVTIASLELVLDRSSRITLAQDLWEVQAKDKSDILWTLGIVQVNGAPKLMYAERTLP
ncbi:hypothetical protein [Arthrobacter sp. HY1533]|uniref:hypothetical protein n=1 Tax=Arthrobacter sp. HY1533 TaxID=2970919 RepID=UPI0022BA058A|nr:hypothetical protein [Arthrobacter sp. HY1533]